MPGGLFRRADRARCVPCAVEGPMAGVPVCVYEYMCVRVCPLYT